MWISITELLKGNARSLELAPDGLTPLPPNGEALIPTGTYADYYEPWLPILGGQLVAADFSVTTLPFDWRLPLRSQQNRLVGRILALASEAEPATIVGHSQGGLLARCAWSALAAAGRTGLVRRIITLGTPHFGTYDAVALTAGYNTTAQQIALLDGLGAAGRILAGLLPPKFPLGYQGVARLAQSFWAAYELFPHLPSPPAALDSLRPALFDAGNWPPITQAPQAILDYAVSDWQPFLRSLSTIPPANILTCVSGQGRPTRAKLRWAKSFGRDESFEFTDEGDGVVTAASATLPGCREASTGAAHFDLFRELVLNGELAALVKEAGANPPPPVIPVGGGSAPVPYFSPPPMASGILAGGDC